MIEKNAIFLIIELTGCMVWILIAVKIAEKKKDNDFGKADDVGPSELRKTAFRFTGQ